MKITIPTTKGIALKDKIFKAVKDETLKTWEIRTDADKVDYLTHKPDQWYDKALLKFTVTKDQLEIAVYWWKSKVPDESIKGYYIGRFAEVLLVHFGGDFPDFTVSK
jgi:hypothetical protein